MRSTALRIYIQSRAQLSGFTTPPAIRHSTAVMHENSLHGLPVNFAYAIFIARSAVQMAETFVQSRSAPCALLIADGVYMCTRSCTAGHYHNQRGRDAMLGGRNKNKQRERNNDGDRDSRLAKQHFGSGSGQLTSHTCIREGACAWIKASFCWL